MSKNKPEVKIHLGHVEHERIDKRLTDLTIDLSWNARLQARTRIDGAHIDPVEGQDGDPENPGLTGLAQSLEAKGQDVPITVVIPTDGPHKGKHFVASGFRRCLACKMLADEGRHIAGKAPGDIVCRVLSDLSMAEIRNMNLRENVRDQITVSDLCYGVMDLFRLNPGITGEEVAVTIGKSSAYVSQLKGVGENLQPALFRQWRESVVKPLPFKIVYAISQLDKREQPAAFAAAMEQAGPKKKDSEGPDPNAWVETMKKKAATLGRAIGALVRLEVLGALADEDALVDNIRDIPGLGKRKKASIRVDRAIAKALLDAYQIASTEAEDEDEGEDGEEVE